MLWLRLGLGISARLRGLFRSSAPTVTDNGNGTVTVTANQNAAPNVTDNGNGTVTIS